MYCTFYNAGNWRLDSVSRLNLFWRCCTRIWIRKQHNEYGFAILFLFFFNFVHIWKRRTYLKNVMNSFAKLFEYDFYFDKYWESNIVNPTLEENIFLLQARGCEGNRWHVLVPLLPGRAGRAQHQVSYYRTTTLLCLQCLKNRTIIKLIFFKAFIPRTLFLSFKGHWKIGI